MKRSNIIRLVIAISITALNACEKDVLQTNEASNLGPYSSLQDFYNQHQADTEVRIINPVQDTILILGDEGTLIGFHANSLVDSNGNLPTGPVTVKMKEVYSMKSMVLSHIPTTSNGAILQSGGMIYLNFSANNIMYKPDTVMGALMPSPAGTDPGMKIYYGQPDAYNGMNWALDPVSTVAETLAFSYYAFAFDSLGSGWMNVAQLYSVSNPVTVPITPVIDAERGETVNFAVYLMFPSINSVMNVINTSTPGNIVANNIPQGMQAVAAVLGVGSVTHKAYFGKASFTAASTQNVSVTVTQMTDEQIEDSLSGL